MLRFWVGLFGVSVIAAQNAQSEDFGRRISIAHSDVRQLMGDIPNRINRCTANGRFDSRHRLCHCLPNYAGVYCEIPICRHGLPAGGSCICDEQYNGKFCDQRVVQPVYDVDDSRVRVILLTVGAVLIFSALLFGTRLAVGKWLESSSTMFTEWNLRNKCPSTQTLCEKRHSCSSTKSQLFNGTTNAGFSGPHYDSM